MAFSARSWRSPDTITVLTTVANADVSDLREHLSKCEAELRITELSMVHFLRIFVIDPDDDLDGRPLPARLVISVVFDGRADAMLSAWIGLAGDALVRLLSHCIAGPLEPDDVLPFVMAHAVLPDTYHVGTFGSTVQQIREEERCAVGLRTFIDERYAPTAAPPVTAEEVLEGAREFVKDQPDLPQRPRPRRTRWSWILKQADLVRSGLVVAALPLAMAFVCSRRRSRGVFGFVRSFVASSAVVAGTAVAVVRYLEITEADTVIGQDDAKVYELEQYEDLITQNQFTMVAAVRNTMIRRFILRVTLFLSDTFSKHLAPAGKLVGVDTIHFARIHRIDDGRRFLFMSDFDGGWNRYLFDFLTVGSFAVVPNWTNLLGCPKTKLLFIPRPGFAQRFLPFTRARQIHSDIWYSARPTLTVGDILRHADIREGLYADDVDAAAWVRKL